MNTAQPLVSIIIPAYNCHAYIGEALNSVLNQDYPHKQIIVVNDGSTDATMQVLQAFGDRIDIVDQHNQGPAAARNTGLDKARGSYVSFLDGDDIWCPGKLTAQVDYLQEHHQVGMVFSNWNVWYPSAGGVFAQADRGCQEPAAHPVVEEALCGWIYTDLLLDCVVHTITAMIRAEVVEKVGRFDTTLLCGEDYNYWLRVSRITPIHKLRPILAAYRHHGGNITAKPKPIDYEYEVIERAVQSWGLAGPQGGKPLPKQAYQQRMAALSFSYGYSHFWHGSAASAKQGFQRCLHHDAGNRKARWYRRFSGLKSSLQSWLPFGNR